MNIEINFDSEHGLGHAYRSIALARVLRDRGHQVWFSNQSGISKQLTSRYFGKDTHPDKTDWLIVDRVGRNEFWSSESNTKKCFLGATGDLEVDDDTGWYDLVICGGIPSNALCVDARWLVGFEYACVWTSEIDRYTERFPMVYWYGSTWYDERIQELAYRVSKQMLLTVRSPEPLLRADHLIASSLVCVAPFGMTTLEAMYLGTPTVSYNLNPYADKSFRAAPTLHVDLNDLDHAVDAVQQLYRGYYDAAREEYTHMWPDFLDAGKKFIDGKGCERVAIELERRL